MQHASPTLLLCLKTMFLEIYVFLCLLFHRGTLLGLWDSQPLYICGLLSNDFKGEVIKVFTSLHVFCNRVGGCPFLCKHTFLSKTNCNEEWRPFSMSRQQFVYTHGIYPASACVIKTIAYHSSVEIQVDCGTQRASLRQSNCSVKTGQWQKGRHSKGESENT